MGLSFPECTLFGTFQFNLPLWQQKGSNTVRGIKYTKIFYHLRFVGRRVNKSINQSQSRGINYWENYTLTRQACPF